MPGAPGYIATLARLSSRGTTETIVKIRLEEIREAEKDATFVEEVREINEALSRTGAVDFQFPTAVPIELHHYRVGADLLFRGRFDASVTGTCARCLSDYSFPLAEDFRFVLKPAAVDSSERELSEEDLSLSFYDGDEVDLSPLVREAMMLALPTRPLCKDDCRGLCPHCGTNRNLRACDCRDEWIDPRLEVLRAYTRKH